MNTNRRRESKELVRVISEGMADKTKLFSGISLMAANTAPTIAASALAFAHTISPALNEITPIDVRGVLSSLWFLLFHCYSTID